MPRQGRRRSPAASTGRPAPRTGCPGSAAHPERVVRLTENRRQRTEAGREVARALHARDVDAAWIALLNDDGVLVARNREHKLDTVAAKVVDAITEHGPAQVTCDAVTNVEVDELNSRIHARLVSGGQIDPGTVTRYRTHTGDRELGAGTMLRVVAPFKAAGRGEGLVRGERVIVTEAGRDRVQIVFDDGRTRSLTPRTLFAHLDYGYAGTTHKVQGQTSAVHIATLDRNKDVASLYVSATRGRDRTVFVADARDWLTDVEMSTSLQWPPGQLDDEVLDRVVSHRSASSIASTRPVRRWHRGGSPRGRPWRRAGWGCRCDRVD